jgi:hypothetical protein
MSRWFRHYAGMMRDEKLVSAAIRSKQPVERVVWVWGALLESAAEMDRGGETSADPAEMAYFLHCELSDIESIIDMMRSENMLDGDTVVEWTKYSRHCTRLPWSEWAVIRLGVFQRDDFTCRYCGAHGVPLECDHVIPLSRGGTNERKNLVTACRPCNGMKSDRTPQEMGWAL